MTCFLAISIGASPDTARPLFASTAPAVIRHAIRGLFGILDRDERGEPELLELAVEGGDYQWGQRDIDFELERADALESVGHGEPNSGAWRDEMAALAAWHRERARAIARLVLQSAAAAEGAAFIALKRDAGGSLYIDEPLGSSEPPLILGRNTEGALHIVESFPSETSLASAED